MPGILPMKVIKIGSNAQTRIAQACDRCRSKKIRCDGIRPCCTQCANVGFECKTSDKLSRRAFPRGYTESLEERVRSLEGEVRELKDLLDEKDEKIDMLSHMHSNSPQSFVHHPTRRESDSSHNSNGDDLAILDEPDERFKVRQAAYLMKDGTESYFAGTSSACNFIESFKKRATMSGFDVDDVDTTTLLTANLGRRLSDASSVRSSTSMLWTAPPRLLSDQLVNIFFQEWAPLFPVLHRPSFLEVYGRYLADAESVTSNAELAHLNLVFAIAASGNGHGIEELQSFETQWKAAIDLTLNDNTMENLQALVLAQIHCLQRQDLTRLLSYKGVSIGLSSRLGLHQVQKTFSLDPLNSETRKKVFWTLYTVDCFSSVVLGLPKHIKDADVSCEYPNDIDDEYVSSSGFQPTLPGEFTKLSTALALFKAARILSRVLDHVYPAKASYELSLKNLADFTDELELWEAALPTHLRLQFAQDKPSTGTITSRSPLLSLVYHYIRALIQRPAISALSLGNRASSALLIHASSCKRIVQIVQLLEERGLSFSLCLNKDEILVLCGIGSLYQQLKLDTGSKILKDNLNTLSAIYRQLHRAHSPCTIAFRSLVSQFIPEFAMTSISPAMKGSIKSKPSLTRGNSDQPSEQSLTLPTSTRRQLKAIASRFSAHANGKIPTLATHPAGHVSLDSLSLQPPTSRVRDHVSLSPILRTSPSTAGSASEASTSPKLVHSRPLSVSTNMSAITPIMTQKSSPSKRPSLPTSTNLDYLSFGNEPEQAEVSIDMEPIKTEAQPTDWERLLGDLDNGSTNIFDASYGGRPIEALAETSIPIASRATAMSDAALAWNAGLLTLKELSKRKSNATIANGSVRTSNSIWSGSSDEGFGSIDDPSSTEWTSASSNNDAPEKTFTSLDLADIGVTFDFDSELGPEWQENVVSSEA